MKKITALIIGIILVLALAGCNGTSTKDDGILSIVVTAFPHYDFARQITKGVENAEIKMLISPGSEIHSYEPSPSDILAISECDVFIYTGGESDTWAKNILSSSEGNMKVISFMEICSDDGHENNREKHTHEYDEHVWTNPVMAMSLAEHICSTLSETDTENAELYSKNLNIFLSKLENLDVSLRSIMQNAVRDSIIVADRFPFYHLASHYGIGYESAFPGCSSSTEPSASVIAALSQKVKNDGIPYVFTIEFSNGKIAKSVTEGTDAGVLPLHSCHNVSKEDFENGVTYCSLMSQNAENLRKALCE